MKTTLLIKWLASALLLINLTAELPRPMPRSSRVRAVELTTDDPDGTDGTGSDGVLAGAKPVTIW